ncbi:MAG: F510_1955 family glycosylhydrolase [Acidimicrobiales bacterium]
MALAVPTLGVLLARSLGGPAETVTDGAVAPGVEHVHGLGVNPADGTLYVATHFGTFRLTDDDAERVGASFQDTMGFTVVGNNHFLGSGHPDIAGLQAGQPRRLGLIESTDGGDTWRSLSLSGEVDFHALAAIHDRVYGWDSTSGRFLVSSDRETWDERSTLDLHGFAVDPTDPNQIVAATPTGVQVSVDGGRSWRPVDGPPLIAVSWDAGSGLWAADADGVVAMSADGGQTWEPQGRLPGPPQALLAHGTILYAAAVSGDRTGIYQSTDEGETWTLRYDDQA